MLYVEELPQTSTEALIQFFQAYNGFKEVRYVAPKNCAFVEFEDVFEAGIALNMLNGYKFTEEYAMKIRYAKK